MKRTRVYHTIDLKEVEQAEEDLAYEEVGYWISIKGGAMFQGRSGHGAITIGKKLFVFGGCIGQVSIEDGWHCNDIRCFDFDKETWRRVVGLGKAPSGRASFAMCHIPNTTRIIIAGGTGEDQVFGDIFEFDTKTNIWSELSADIDSSPCKLYGQSVCSFGESLYFFGGSTGYRYRNSTYQFHVPTQSWTELTTIGAVPSPRYQHTATKCGNFMLIIGGGNYTPDCPDIEVYSLNLETLEWVLLQTKGVTPMNRAAHTTEYDENTGMVFVGGGFNASLERLSDFYALHLEDLRWKRITSNSSQTPCASPSARAFHASCLCNGSLYVIGGSDCELRLGDIWEYKYLISPSTLMEKAASVVFKDIQKHCANAAVTLDLFKSFLPHELIAQLRFLKRQSDRHSLSSKSKLHLIGP